MNYVPVTRWPTGNCQTCKRWASMYERTYNNQGHYCIKCIKAIILEDHKATILEALEKVRIKLGDYMYLLEDQQYPTDNHNESYNLLAKIMRLLE